ncbi:MarR family winged helix-turn-helix transcriptional regulator [Georgenia faecalis]|uniref:MarR family winged helix-turn-helix transcriptional regulator n=1 Tax=Georgenia faecalis TaxID=2483799 RepID=UPI001F499AD2|nr:MarR family transcriptional regulator [Georgenia faecalis]
MSTDTPRATAPDQEPAEQAPAAQAPWLTPGQQRDWRSLLGLLMTLPAALDAQLKRDAGVNVFEYSVLAALSEAPDRALALSDLAALAQGSLSRLSHAVTRLERSGWVERCPAVDQAGRRTQARLTDGGMVKVKEIAPGHVREVRRLVVDSLTPEQLVALGEAARTIAAVTTAGASDACRRVGDC